LPSTGTTTHTSIFHSTRHETKPQNLAAIWPGGTIPFAGALKGQPGSVQFGYSDGMQFPPFNAIDGADTVLSVFVPGFVLPIQFRFDQDVDVQGVKLKRCVCGEGRGEVGRSSLCMRVLFLWVRWGKIPTRRLINFLLLSNPESRKHTYTASAW
jgi:hypothetical protein